MPATDRSASASSAAPDLPQVEQSGNSRLSRWAEDTEPIHLWFSLTYANYLVLPRSVLQSMPQPWQARFCEMLDEMDASFGHLDWPSYRVNAVDSSTGRFKRDPIPHYNRGRTTLEPRNG